MSVFQCIALAAPSSTMMAVTEAVARRHGTTASDLRIAKQKHLLAPARQEAMALCYALGKSNMQVARFFGLKDHSTVIHARRRYAERAERGRAA